MDSWMVMKQKGESSFKLNNYETACNNYKEALVDIENKFDESKPELKIEASKISSNISMMYLILYKENHDEMLLHQSKLYANKTIKYNPKWVKGYRRLQEVCKEMKDLNDVLERVSVYIKDNRDGVLNDDFHSLLVDIKYYTHQIVIKLSPSWHLLRFPNNVYVIDPLGAGHYKTLKEFLSCHGESVKEISILVRPGIYVGTYLLNNANVDIVGDCEVEINSRTKAIDKDPKVIFTNTTIPIPITLWIKHHHQMSWLSDIIHQTFYFGNCKVSIQRLSVQDQIMHHPIHAIACIKTELNLIECSFNSRCSASLSCSDKSKVRCKRCRSVGSYGGVITGTSSHVKLTDCFISETIGMGIEVTDETEQITLKNCTITKCKKQGIAVYSGSKSAKILDSTFETNCTETTINEGSIQLRCCRVLVKNTTVKSQNSNGIVIEGGSGNFDNVLIENCTNGILVQGNVVIKNCNINRCVLTGISLCHVIKGQVVLENNTIKDCFPEMVRFQTSPMPVFKGHKKHVIETSSSTAMKHFMEIKSKIKIKSRSKKTHKGQNFGPVGEVFEINEKGDLFSKPWSAAVCELCGYSEYQLQKQLKSCGKCKIALYCSTKCQEKDWKFHKRHCVLADVVPTIKTKIKSSHCKSSDFEKEKEFDMKQKNNKATVGTVEDQSKLRELNSSVVPEWKRKNKKKKLCFIFISILSSILVYIFFGSR